MRKRNWILFILICFILISAGYMAAVASSASSSVDEWTMFRHDSNRSGYTAGSGSANSTKLLWNYTTSKLVRSSPAVANGYVFVGCWDGHVYCLSASNGELLWNHSGHEFDSSPAIDNGFVYIGSDDGYVYCLDIATGTTFWRTEIGGAVRSSPAVVDGRVYVGSGDHDMFCLNASNGDELWSYPTSSRVYSSPAVSDGVVYIPLDDFCVYALNASDGKEIWRTHTGTVLSSPSVHDGYVYVGSIDGYVCGLNASTGAMIWQYQTEDTVSSCPAVAYGCVYVGSEDNNVYCLNATNGKKIWQSPTGYWVRSSPAVADGNVYVGSEDYNIYCFNASTGAKKWSYATGDAVDSSPAVVNGVLYVGSCDCHVYALAFNNSTAETASSQVTSSVAWTTIAFDVAAGAVAAVIVLAIARFVHSTKRAKLETDNFNAPSQKRRWFSRHTDALCILAILAFSTVFFINLGSGPLWAADEQTYSQWAFYMFKAGDYLNPRAFGAIAVWIAKPPLFMWLMSLAYQVFGVTNFAARFWSAVFGALSLVAVFYLGKKLYNLPVGFISALVLGTFTTFYVFARHAMTDVPFVFFTVASIYFLILSEEPEKPDRYAVLGGVFFGLALMTKQIQALLILIVVFFYYIAAERSPRFLFTKRFTLFWGVALLIFSPWLVYMTFSFKEFWQWLFLYGIVDRAATPLEGHAGGYLFYFSYIANNENLLWVILLPFAAGLSVFNSFKKHAKADTLILTWMLTVLLLFTFVQSKFEWYILPAFPAFAIAISSFLHQLIKKAQLAVRWLSSKG
jgi:outer membrane protein assembly factor BamB